MADCGFIIELLEKGDNTGRFDKLLVAIDDVAAETGVVVVDDDDEFLTNFS